MFRGGRGVDSQPRETYGRLKNPFTHRASLRLATFAFRARTHTASTGLCISSCIDKIVWIQIQITDIQTFVRLKSVIKFKEIRNNIQNSVSLYVVGEWRDVIVEIMA